MSGSWQVLDKQLLPLINLLLLICQVLGASAVAGVSTQRSVQTLEGQSWHHRVVMTVAWDQRVWV